MLLLAIGIVRPRWLLVTFVFLAPIVPVNVGYSILGERGMTVSPVRLVAVCLAVAIGIRFLLWRAPAGFPLAIPFVLLIGVRAIGLLVAPDKIGGAILLIGEYGVLTSLLSYGAYCVVRRPSHLSLLISAVLAAAMIAGSMGFWEWETDRYFAATPLVRHFMAVPVSSETIDMKTEGLKRITGPFAHSLIMAGFMAFLIPICMQRAGTRRRLSRAMHYATLAVMVLALVLTFGRAALVVTVAEVLAVLRFGQRRRVWPIAVGILAIALVMLPVYARFRSPGEKTSLLLPKAQMAVFVTRYQLLASDFLSYPPATLLGFGFGRNDMSAVSPLGERSWRWGGMDSDFVRVLGTTGVLGFTTWLGLFGWFFLAVARETRRHPGLAREIAVSAFVIGTIGALVQAIPDVSILTYTQTWPIVAICMGGTLGVLDQQKSMRDPYRQGFFGVSTSSRLATRANRSTMQ